MKHRTFVLERALVLAPLALLFLGACTADGRERLGPAAQAAHAATPQLAHGAAPPADAQRILKDVAWLADDAREGRRAGTSQGKACAEYIARRLSDLGLEPAGENGWMQAFSVPLDPRDGGGSTVTHSPTDSQDPFQSKADAEPIFCSESGDVEAEIVYCGFGIENAEREWNDFINPGVSRKIALIVRGVPKVPLPEAAVPSPSGEPKDVHVVSKGDGWSGGGSIFTKVMNAKRHGAVGVILMPSSADEPVLKFDAGHGGRAGIPAVMVTWETAMNLLRAHEPGGHFERFGLQLDKPAPFNEAGSRIRARIHADIVRENGQAYDVLARLSGVDHSRVVLVGAHYDHLGRGGTGSLAPNSGGEIHNGADDNASGTATVLEIARLMKARGTPPCDVLFALWSGEELGLLGSEHWAQHPTVPLDHIQCNLNLDMVGRAGNGKLQVLGAGTAQEFASWMTDAGRESGLDLTVSASGAALGGSSDHQSFVKRGIPALHLFSGLHADYHKPSDDVDKFESNGAAKVAMLGVALVDDMTRARSLTFVEPKIEKDAQREFKSGFRSWFGSVPSYTFEGPGLLLDGTSAGSPAERAGLLKGDILVQIGEVTIDTVNDMVYALQLYKPGDVVLAKYRRDGVPQEVRVTLSSRDVQ